MKWRITWPIDTHKQISYCANEYKISFSILTIIYYINNAICRYTKYQQIFANYYMPRLLYF